MSYSKEEVKEKLEPEDIFTLLEYLEAEPEMFDDYIICRTICHNGDSKKLYYYYNSQLFQCYTHCGFFDVFELVQKVKNLENLNLAIYFVVNFLNLQNQLSQIEEQSSLEDWKIFEGYEREINEENKNTIQLAEYDLNILKYYPQPRILNWENDNILKEVCDYAQIHYDPVEGNILIPHFDENNRCVGIRQRTLLKEKEQWGKYKPWKNRDYNAPYKQILYNHPLAFNLYGFNWSKSNIEKYKIAIIVESEKAVLQYISYFGLANNLCVAVCGNSLSKYQFSLLEKCGVKEIVIAFDKDFKEIDSDDRIELEEKLTKLSQKYQSDVNVSFLFDSQCNVLGYKSSPLDEGKDKFLYLFRNRIIL